MIRTTILVGTLGMALTFAGSARAEGEGEHRFGAKGFIVSADRLAPVMSYESVKTTAQDGGTNTQSRLSLAFFNNGPFGFFGTFYNLPRIAFDWLPVDNVTIGGAFWLYTQLSASDTLSPANGPSTTTDQPKVTYWGVAPRVGYVIPLGHTLAFWPRAGVEYHNVATSSVNGSTSTTITQFSLEAEALLVISPWNHFGFTVGPTADIPITGHTTSQTAAGTGAAGAPSTSTSVDSAMLQFGVSAGMLGHF
jgi:hypothetical protein